MGRDGAPTDGRSWLTAKGETDAVGDGCRDEVTGGQSAGATISGGKNRHVGSPLRIHVCHGRMDGSDTDRLALKTSLSSK